MTLDTEIGENEIAQHNLILFGDTSSNTVLKKIIDKLPTAWTQTEIVAGTRRFEADKHALIAIDPNPRNPRKYVVLNSGFTFRE